MSSTTDFVFELIRAANEIGRLDSYQRRRLFDRVVAKVEVVRGE